MREFNFVTQLRPLFEEDWKSWVTRFILTMQQVQVQQPSVMELPSYPKAKLPSAKRIGLIFVTDEIGGAVPAFSDGTNWRRVTDRAIVS